MGSTAMRFWIGLLLGLLLGIAGTAAYYEIWDPGAAIDAQVDDP